MKKIPVVAGSIIVAALIAVAVVYLGQQLAQRPDEARVVALIEERVQRAEGALHSAPPSAAPGVQKSPAMSDKELDARVRKGIIAFIDEQQHAERDRPNQLARNVPPPSKDDHVYGDPNAPLSLIEYSDFECPYCKSVHATIKRVIDTSNRKVNWVYRHYPLSMHNPGAQREAEASECAAQLGGNEVFWKYADALYTRTRSGGHGFPLENLAPLALELGLDKAAFEQCLANGQFTRKIESQTAEGARAGISGTPGNILYSVKKQKVLALHGAQPYENFRNAIDGF